MRAVRVSLASIGVAVMGYAVLGAARTPAIMPIRQLRFMAVLLIGHDAALVPLFLLAGALVQRLVPAGGRAVVQAGLICSAGVTVVAFPLVLGRGRLADNPSALPRDYPRGLLLTLAVIWLAVAVTLAVKALRARRAGRKGSARIRPVRGRPSAP